MKRLCSFICAVCLVCVSLLSTMTATAAWTPTYYKEDGFLYEIINNEISIVGLTAHNSKSDIVIPETFRGYPVTAISGTQNMTNYDDLTSIYVPATVKSIKPSFFNYGDNLQITVDPANEYFISVDNVIYTKDMTEIVAVARSVRELNISENMTVAAGFFGCRGLREINIDENHPLYTSIDGVVYSKDMKTLICCPRAKNNEVRIPEGVTTWGENAFYNCFNVTYLVIPESVIEINGFVWHDHNFEHVFYTGTEEKWNETFNKILQPYCTIHFNAPHDVEMEITQEVTYEESTCTTYSKKYLHCSTCDEVELISSYKNVEHDYRNLKWVVANSYKHECSACGDIIYVKSQYEEGDANGDGKINSTDFMLARRHFLELITLDNEGYMGADINRDGIVNSTDFMQIRRKYLGI